MHSSDRSAVLFVMADCPGYFVHTAQCLAETVRDAGLEPVFAVGSPYYEHFKDVDLSKLGEVHYLSEFLASCPDGPEVEAVELDYWLTHATFIRNRFFWGRHRNPWSSYKKTMLFFRRLVEDSPPLAAAWSEIPSNATISIAHHVCTRRNLRFLGYISARVPAYFNVALDRYATELLPNPSPPDHLPSPDDAPEYMKTAVAAANPRLLERVRRAPAELWRGFRSASAPSLETGNTMIYQIRAVTKQLGRKLYHSLIVPRRTFTSLPERGSGEIAVLFPLHYRPEASTSVHARFYENDAEVIRNIAFSLPHRARLYVKEHPAAIGTHSRAFFQEISSYPNVRLLAEEPALATTLDRFDLLVCLTSTAGFEAIQKGIPVLLLGRTFYESYPGVIRIDSWEQLATELAKVTPNAPHRPDPEPMKRYLRCCFPGTFNYLDPAVLHPDNIRRLAEPLLHVVEDRA